MANHSYTTPAKGKKPYRSTEKLQRSDKGGQNGVNNIYKQHEQQLNRPEKTHCEVGEI